MEVVNNVKTFSNWWLWSAIFSVLTIIYFATKRDSRVTKYLNSIKGPTSLPVLGVALYFLRPSYEFLGVIHSWHQKYGPVYKIWLGNRPYVLLAGAAEVEKILSSTVHTEKSTDYSSLEKWLGTGLLTAKPKKWHGRRKLLTPAFHFSILEQFTAVFNEQGNIFVDILKSKHCNGKPFDLYPYVTRCAMDIICETAMGNKLHAQSSQELDYVKAVYGYGDFIVQMFVKPWFQLGLIAHILGRKNQEKKYLKVLHGFTEKVIAERKMERKQCKGMDLNPASSEMDGSFKKRKAFLDLLLDVAETDSTFTDIEIRQEVDTFMFEGHDTTAANMIWTLFLFSLYPEHQTRVQNELREIFGEDINRDITPTDISKMKYLECCVKESLRLYPSVPAYMRYLNEDVDLGNNCVIPARANVIINAYNLHRDPNVFPDPETFNPERFKNENIGGSGRSPYAYVPFSAGPRNCIGQKFALLEEKIVLAKFLLNFNMESVRKREDMKMVADIILRPYEGVHVKLTRRTKIL